MGLRKTTTLEPLRPVIGREHPRDIAGLSAQLRAGDAEQRRWAARDLVEHPGACPLLGAALLAETDSSVREAIFTSLAAIASEGAVAALLPLLRSEDAQLRNGAIEALAGMPDAVAPSIAELLRDRDSDVRIFTVNLLADLRHNQVLSWLQQVLQHDTEVNVVAAAIEVLAEAGSPDHVDALRAVCRRFADDPFITFAAAMAVERIESA
jgi:HEAT repeat protein